MPVQLFQNGSEGVAGEDFVAGPVVNLSVL